jgi:hypothetical protein
MTDSKSTKAHGAFDNLLDDDAPTAEAIHDIADNARAEREAAREGVRLVAAHLRDRGEQAARLAHEKAHALGTSVRRHTPSVAGRLRAAVARQIATPIRWRVVAPILLGSVAASAGVLAALLAWNTHRFAVLETQGVAPEQHSAPPAAESVATKVPDVASETPVAAPTPNAPNTITPSPTVAVPPVAAQSEPAIATPITPTLPPVPGEPSRESCAAAVPLLNGLFASGAHARTPDEIAWAAFGYRCVQNGALSYSPSGYAPAAPRAKDGGARTDARVSATTHTPKPTAKPKTSVAATTTPPPIASAPLPTPAPANALGACVLRVTATTTEGSVMPNVPVYITGVGGSRFEQRVNTDGEGRLTANVPTNARVRVILRARGYLDDVRESMNCAPVALTGKKSNPLSSIFDAARRADRSIQDATGRR